MSTIIELEHIYKSFNKNEVFMISPKDCKIINEKELESVINDISKDNHDNKNKW